ncbi:MAG: hypothetical protein FWB72_02800 [Firmicutes bacterium]|nr:hypothetical protein [Bacillota bacterium]
MRTYLFRESSESAKILMIVFAVLWYVLVIIVIGFAIYNLSSIRDLGLQGIMSFGTLLIMAIAFTIFPFTKRFNLSTKIDQEKIEARVKKTTYIFTHKQIKGFEILPWGKIRLKVLAEVNNEHFTILTARSKKLAEVLTWIVEKNKYLEGQEFSNQNQTELLESE